ncbi:Hypothetical_protein [Hexamita inflata]|uniref:Hypothetical_protein n=1 Tax=Hexamita inflata TaxID=28002 RepID=A0AA86UPI2_9EUKA|nr:Hypothetical protein HINF_LOCUS44229 [Hexamita inflata]CAI9966595.1 Hypothetical protein HINF_LOCUS54240 [Hexamita inflata]
MYVLNNYSANIQSIIENTISKTKRDTRSSMDIFVELISKSKTANVNTFNGSQKLNGSQNQSELFEIISDSDQSSSNQKANINILVLSANLEFTLKQQIKLSIQAIQLYLKHVKYLEYIQVINNNDLFFVNEQLKQLTAKFGQQSIE